MTDHKLYGTVDNIAQHEPDGATGALSIAAVFAAGVHSVPSTVVVGSPTSSAVDLAQLALTAEQAIALGALLTAAGRDAFAADLAVERMRRHGRSAAKLCFRLAEASDNEVLLDQSGVRLGFMPEAQEIAERAYDAASKEIGGTDWRAIWRTAGESLRVQFPKETR